MTCFWLCSDIIIACYKFVLWYDYLLKDLRKHLFVVSNYLGTEIVKAISIDLHYCMHMS